VGDGGGRPELERNAPANVEFTGWVEYSRLPDEYKRCNAGIALYEVERHRHTSLSSMKTREYLAAGLPVYGTKVGGQEFIAEQGYGLLTTGEIERDIQAFLDRHAQYRRTLAAAASDLFERHSWASVAKTTARCLEDVLQGRAQPRHEDEKTPK
jgi:glycosyltransferase involved in cell wall biosynthesis